jgi:hypothetical protein
MSVQTFGPIQKKRKKSDDCFATEYEKAVRKWAHLSPSANLLHVPLRLKRERERERRLYRRKSRVPSKLASCTSIAGIKLRCQEQYGARSERLHARTFNTHIYTHTNSFSTLSAARGRETVSIWRLNRAERVRAVYRCTSHDKQLFAFLACAPCLKCSRYGFWNTLQII